MINITNKKIKENKINNIETSIQDITQIQFKDNTFDVAITPNIIHLLDKPEQALQELKRIVKPNGTIIIPTYITKTNNNIQKTKKKLLNLVGFNSNDWTEEEYIQKLKNNNMNIIDYKTFKLKEYECTAIIKNNK